MTIFKTILAGVCATFLIAAQMPAQTYYDSSCCDPCYDPCDCCNHWWVSADYLYWQFKETPQDDPLVIAGPTTPLVLDTPGSEVILGGKNIHHKWRSGARVGLGYWFDDLCSWGAEATYTIIPQISKSRSVFSDGSAGSDFLAVPFINAVTGLPDSFVIASPGVFSGFAEVKVSNRLQGAELNGLYRYRPWCSDYSFGFLLGFRWWNFDEHLKFFTDSPFVPPSLVTDIFQTEDSFHTEDNFYGGQLGIAFDYNYCDFFFNVKAKVALGVVYHELKIDGELFTNDFATPPFDPSPAETFVGGLFAQPTNIGTFKHHEFAWVPEVNINIGYNVTDCFRIKIGYNFLYINKVWRAGEQIDPFINTSQSVVVNGPDAVLVGVAAPLAPEKSTNFWAQGLNVGFDFAF